MSATKIVNAAKRGCHLKGIVLIPLKLRAPTIAVKSIRRKVKSPPNITNGFPRNSDKAKV